MSDFCKSNDGRIHLKNGIASEFTMCGNAFDGDQGGSADPHTWEACPEQPITCDECARAIRHAQNRKIARHTIVR